MKRGVKGDMKSQTVELLWNVAICFGLVGLFLFFTLLFSSFLLIAQENGSHNYSGFETVALSLFCLFASVVMLRLSKGLDVLSSDTKFFTKKNVEILLIGTMSVLVLSGVEVILMKQKIINTAITDPIVEQFFMSVPSVVLILFSFIFAPIMEEVVFRGGIIGLIFRDKLILGVIVSSLIYSLMVDPEGIINWGLCLSLNIILGLAYIKTGRLEVPIIIKMIAFLFTTRFI